MDGRYEVLFLGTGEADDDDDERLLNRVDLKLNFFSIFRPRNCPESYCVAQRSDNYGGADTRGGGGLPGRNTY